MPRDTYFLELRAISIYRSLNKRSNRFNYSRTLLIKLKIQDTTTQQPITFAESLQWVPTESIQGTIKCIDACLRAQLSVTEGEEREWTLKILGSERTALEVKLQALDQTEEETLEPRQTKSIGQCKLNPLIYVEVFNESGKTKFQENIQISSSLSLDYEVYIHKTQEGLEEVLWGEANKSQLRVQDTAFKKTLGVPKIRCVQLNENRERSLRMQEFEQHQQHQISSLKKSGAKFVPIKQQPSSKNAIERKCRDMRRQQQIERSRSQSSSCCLKGTRKRDSSLAGLGQPRYIVAGDKRGEKRGYSLVSCLYLAMLVLGVIGTGYMMFPSKKV